jgi:DNA-binding SARP family transcriptional activator
VRYRILGPLEVYKDATVTTPTAPKTASVLAMLLIRANHLVLAETLTDEIWSGTPPASASTTLQTYIYQIRCALGRDAIFTRPGGYVFPVDESEFDLTQFRAKVRDGEHLLYADQPDAALDRLRAGLDLWKGEPLSNVRVGRALELELQHLDEERRRACELSIEAAFAAGRHREVIGKLKQMVAEDPYNEWLHARLIEALTAAGRRRDALRVYDSLRRVLAEQLGLDPMRELRDLERHVLEC